MISFLYRASSSQGVAWSWRNEDAMVLAMTSRSVRVSCRLGSCDERMWSREIVRSGFS